MIKNFYRLLIMVRDKPLLFFAITMPLFLICTVSLMAVLVVVSEIFLDRNADNYAIIRWLFSFIIFTPFMPFLFLVMFLLAESYIYTVLWITRLGWLLGVKERRLANDVAAWAEKRLGVRKTNF